MNTLKNKTIYSTSGFTLIEVIVAIAISTPVLLLIFFYFADIEKGRLFQSSQSRDLISMISYKKCIDASVDSVLKIETISEIELRGRDIRDSLLIVRFSNKSIYCNNRIICSNIKSFKLEKDQNCEQKTVLLWECTFENGGWIGGGKLFQ
jgi:prepilin-type N-terminal cleavage/methylation domain-containing protein